MTSPINNLFAGGISSASPKEVSPRKLSGLLFSAVKKLVI